MIPIEIRRANLDDCDTLAAMNRSLIEDEGSRNTMSQIELSERMRRWLKEGWTALLIITGKMVVGYMLYQERHDEYQPQRVEIYVRQYFVSRLFRGKGIGQAAFQHIQAEYFPPGATLALDVLATNPAARRFWEKLGFRAYAENLRLEKRGDTG